MKKVVVITGSSGGIGSELVKKYLNDSFLVIALDKSNKLLINSEQFKFIKVDLFLFSLTYEYRINIIDEIKNLLPNSLKEFVLINNAAEQILKNTIDTEWDDFHRSFAINASAPFFLVQGLLEPLKSSNGHVINISSIHAKLTKANFACYASSKAALESLTRSLAIEISHYGISVNAIAPAAIETNMLRHGFNNDAGMLKNLESYHPAHTIGKTQDLASFIKSITENRGGFLTGSILEFNGGIGGLLHDPK